LCSLSIALFGIVNGVGRLLLFNWERPVRHFFFSFSAYLIVYLIMNQHYSISDHYRERWHSNKLAILISLDAFWSLFFSKSFADPVLLKSLTFVPWQTALTLQIYMCISNCSFCNPLEKNLKWSTEFSTPQKPFTRERSNYWVGKWVRGSGFPFYQLPTENNFRSPRPGKRNCQEAFACSNPI